MTWLAICGAEFPEVVGKIIDEQKTDASIDFMVLHRRHAGRHAGSHHGQHGREGLDRRQARCEQPPARRRQLPRHRSQMSCACQRMMAFAFPARW